MDLGMATVAVEREQTRWSVVALALVFGLVVGAFFSYYGISKDGTDTYITTPAAKFDSPRVTDLPMGEAIDNLVSSGYRVVAVGTGRVVLQEKGFRGHVLRIVGEDGGGLRYCTVRLPNCVAIEAPPGRGLD